MKYYIGYYNALCDNKFRVVAMTMDSVEAHFILRSYLELNKDYKSLGLVYKVFTKDELPKNWIYSKDNKEEGRWVQQNKDYFL